MMIAFRSKCWTLGFFGGPPPAAQQGVQAPELPPSLVGLSSNHNLLACRCRAIASARSSHTCFAPPCLTRHHHHHAPRTPTIEAPMPPVPARASAMLPYSSRPLAAQPRRAHPVTARTQHAATKASGGGLTAES